MYFGGVGAALLEYVDGTPSLLGRRRYRAARPPPGSADPGGGPRKTCVSLFQSAAKGVTDQPSASMRTSRAGSSSAVSTITVSPRCRSAMPSRAALPTAVPSG